LGSRRNRVGWSASSALLNRQQIRHGVTLARMPLSARDRVTPGRGIGGVAREEVRHACVIERVVRRQTPDPGKPTDINGEPGTTGGICATGVYVVGRLGRQA
jgi:hypothetical protein